jgi:hypothetical protein
MYLKDFSLLTDENILADVAQFLRNTGFNVKDVKEGNLHGSTDVDLLRLCLMNPTKG